MTIAKQEGSGGLNQVETGAKLCQVHSSGLVQAQSGSVRLFKHRTRVYFSAPLSTSHAHTLTTHCCKFATLLQINMRRLERVLSHLRPCPGTATATASTDRHSMRNRTRSAKSVFCFAASPLRRPRRFTNHTRQLSTQSTQQYNHHIQHVKSSATAAPPTLHHHSHSLHSYHHPPPLPQSFFIVHSSNQAIHLNQLHTRMHQASFQGRRLARHRGSVQLQSSTLSQTDIASVNKLTLPSADQSLMCFVCFSVL